MKKWPLFSNIFQFEALNLLKLFMIDIQFILFYEYGLELGTLDGQDFAWTTWPRRMDYSKRKLNYLAIRKIKFNFCLQ